MLDWLIVGGGIHGTLLSRVLVEEVGIAADRVRVLDPHDEPLWRFRRCAAATGLDYLRSSVVHHLDADPMALRRFAETRRRRDELHGIYQRPGLELFTTHCDHVIERAGLRALRLRGEALEIGRRRSALRVETSAGELAARHVALALGPSDQPLRPAWAEELRASGAPVRHVFEEEFRLDEALASSHSIILGGGLSAVQVALWLAARRPGAVTLLSRHPVRVHEFDSDSHWMGPRGARGFASLAGRGERRALIGRERHRGSVPAELARALARHVGRGSIAWVEGEVETAAPDRLAEGGAAAREGKSPAAPGLELVLRSGRRLRGDRLLLATGFDPRRPGGAFMDRTIERLGLEYAACGYPAVDASLRWAPGLYVTGPLAELEIGPVARNILGARLAGQRLAAAAGT